MSEKVALSLTRVVNFSDSAASEETGGVEITNTSASICNDTCEDTDDIVNSESAKLAKVVGVIGTIKYFGTFFGKDKYDDEEKGDDDEEISTRGRKASQINNDFDRLDDLVELGKDRLINLDMTENYAITNNVKIFTVLKLPNKTRSPNLEGEGNDGSTAAKEYQYRCELEEKTLKCLYDDIKTGINDIVNRKRKSALERIKGTKEGVKNAVMRTSSVDNKNGADMLEDEYFGSYDCKMVTRKDIIDWFKRALDYTHANCKGDSKKKHHLEHRITYRRFCVLLNLHKANIIMTKNRLYYIIPGKAPGVQTRLSAADAAVWNKTSLRNFVEMPKDYNDPFIYYVLSVLGGRDNVQWKTDNKFEFSNSTSSSFCLTIYTIYFYLFLHDVSLRVNILNRPKGLYTLVTTKMDGGSKGEDGRNSCTLSLGFAQELTNVKRELGYIKADIAKFIKLFKDIRGDDDNLRYLSLDEYDVDFFQGLETMTMVRTVHGGAASNSDSLNFTDPFKSIDFDGTEMLIKHYILDFEAQDNEVDYMVNELQFNEKSLELRLETSRNDLTLINTYYTITSAFFGFGGFIAGIFGMNLDNSTTTEPGLVQSKKGSFIVVSVISAAIIIVGVTTTYYYLLLKKIIPEKLHIRKAELDY